MSRLGRVAVVVSALIVAASIAMVTRAADPPPGQPAAPPPGAPQGPPHGMSMPAPTDSFATERDSLMKVVLEKIAGRENAPAESVFKEIKVMKGMPAGRLVRIMNMGFSRSLGVSCKHCHDVTNFADEGKKQKQIAREMMALSRTINDEMLPKIANLQSEKPTINCTTCHRGQLKPGTNL